MKYKVLAGVMAVAIAGTAMLAPTEASARWRRGGWGWGAGAAGFAAGAIIGGALASPYYYGGGPYGYYGPGYAPGYAYPPAVVYEGGGGNVAYCMQRFKSYDPGSGTYLGYDGLRHPC